MKFLGLILSNLFILKAVFAEPEVIKAEDYKFLILVTVGRCVICPAFVVSKKFAISKSEFMSKEKIEPQLQYYGYLSVTMGLVEIIWLDASEISKVAVDKGTLIPTVKQEYLINVTEPTIYYDKAYVNYSPYVIANDIGVIKLENMAYEFTPIMIGVSPIGEKSICRYAQWLGMERAVYSKLFYVFISTARRRIELDRGQCIETHAFA